MKDLTQRIGLLIRARYPLLQLVSHEEARVEKTLQRVATEEKLAVYRWAATRGLVAPDGKPIPQSEGAAGALAACEAIVEPALLVSINKVAAAKIPAFLDKYAATVRERRAASAAVAA